MREVPYFQVAGNCLQAKKKKALVLRGIRIARHYPRKGDKERIKYNCAQGENAPWAAGTSTLSLTEYVEIPDSRKEQSALRRTDETQRAHILALSKVKDLLSSSDHGRIPSTEDSEDRKRGGRDSPWELKNETPADPCDLGRTVTDGIHCRAGKRKRNAR